MWAFLFVYPSLYVALIMTRLCESIPLSVVSEISSIILMCVLYPDFTPTFSKHNVAWNLIPPPLKKAKVLMGFVHGLGVWGLDLKKSAFSQGNTWSFFFFSKMIKRVIFKTLWVQLGSQAWFNVSSLMFTLIFGICSEFPPSCSSCSMSTNVLWETNRNKSFILGLK
ncbi:uncharacterized protein EV154DRAFT_8480 [Mucor mucedo]|uniref:uncharacterized protein n=1 Tax=Mucor mucedo TaxID=29922 RepID=UPI00221E8043|nr:uncharacterized protein EV154DRAFT_8480 [Mucor mucedo]KAI7895567.1 hypothetical protein EV154DRAFT_8480 [Mucor mucedo]